MSTSPVDLHEQPHDGHGGDDGHGHDNPHHQHHFTTMEQQFDTSKIGMWLFLATEVLLFGGLFVGFGLMQARFPLEFKEAHEHLQRPLGAFVFLGVKYFEYSHKFEEGLLPGHFYKHVGDKIQINGHSSPGYATFFSFYFMMTGLHGIHIVVGIALLAWIAVRGNRGEFNSNYYTPVDLVGLYWHLVDLIWIYLFPLYYLIT
jgi:cytochrome c oxidase subunit 3